MNVKSFKVIINRFHFNKFGAGAWGLIFIFVGAYNRMYYFVCRQRAYSRGIEGSI